MWGLRLSTIQIFQEVWTMNTLENIEAIIDKIPCPICLNSRSAEAGGYWICGLMGMSWAFIFFSAVRVSSAAYSGSSPLETVPSMWR